MRASELIGLTVDDIDREQSIAFVMGRGGRGRACPLGARTADALRWYMRVRIRHPTAATTSALGIGTKGAMTHSGIAQMLIDTGVLACSDVGQRKPKETPARRPMDGRPCFNRDPSAAHFVLIDTAFGRGGQSWYATA
jgi:hypothetical protein